MLQTVGRRGLSMSRDRSTKVGEVLKFCESERLIQFLYLAAPSDSNSEEETPLWKKFIMPSTALALGTIAVSKELLILNEELLIVFTFSTALYLGYKNAGGQFAKMLDDKRDQVKQ